VFQLLGDGRVGSGPHGLAMQCRRFGEVEAAEDMRAPADAGKRGWR
jgi:hypothetical protein